MKPKREPVASYRKTTGECECKPSFRVVTLQRGRGTPRTLTTCKGCKKSWPSEPRTSSPRTF